MKKRKNWLCVILALFIFVLSSGTVYAEESEEEAEDKTLAPYFFIQGADMTVDRFPLKDTTVTANVNGTIAETYVTQTYANEGKNPINAKYVFPASTKVTVHGMKMEIGNQVVTAQIKEREEAKEEFEEAKSEGKSVSLLEQQRANVFTMDIANIMPGDTVKVTLHYSELIVSTEGTYQFVFPTVVGPRYVASAADTEDENNLWAATPYLGEDVVPPGTYDITVNLNTGVPIAGLASPSHDVTVKKSNDSSAQIKLTNPKDFAGNRDYILEYKLTGDEVNCGLLLNSGEEENFFMLTVQPPERYQSQDIPPREYIFVLDVSGSMYGYPLDTAKELIKNLVNNLRETDTFNLILFSGASSQMSPKSLPATSENIKNAISFIDKEEGGGGTELASAMENAIAIPKNKNVSRSIVTITDGYIFDETEIFDIIHKNLSSTSFFSFGIGTSVNRYLIEGIAKAGLGESFVVTEAEEAAETAERFRTYIQSPILTDIQVTYDGFDVYDVEPKALPTLFAKRPIVLFGKWKGEAAGTIRITGKTGSEDYVKEISISEIQPQETNEAIRYLWARTRVDRLTAYGFNKENEAVKKEITEIGLKYSMMTPYTSFIAVLDTIRNPGGNGTDVDQPLPMPLEVSNFAVGYTVGSEPGDFVLISFLAILMLTGCLSGKRKKHMR